MASQNFDTLIPCCNVSPELVPADDKSSWCQANLNTCTEVCGGQGQTSGNTCDQTSLDYSCKCSNGTDISSALAAYSFTVPGQMCQFWFGQCISATNGNSQQQSECDKARNAKCGTRILGSSAESSLRSAAASATSARASASRRTSASVSTASPSNDPRLSASSASSSSWSSLTDLPTIVPGNRNRPLRNSGPSIGAIAGAVVGSLLGLVLMLTLIWLFLRRRKARRSAAPTAGDTGSSYDEKEVSDPVNMILPLKAELPGEGSSGPGGFTQVAYHNAAWQHASHHGTVSEMDASTNAELYAGSPRQTHCGGTSLQGADRPHEIAELHSSTPHPSTEHSASPNPPISLIQTHHQQSSNDLHTQSISPERGFLQRQLSAEEITALEEEERRIDAELEEVKRMKELRDQKIAIQQKLRDAKGAS